MVMLQRLSETQSAASPLQAQAHRVAKQVEALLTDTYDLLSSSVKEVVSPLSMVLRRSNVNSLLSNWA